MSDPTAVRRPVWSLTMHEENLGLEYVTQVEHLQLEFDEARAPRVICRADVALPKIATRAWIDPRAQVRGYVAAGYGEGGDPGSFLLANLGLRGRRIRHGDGVLELDHAGDEALMIDGAVSASSLSAASTLAAIEALVTQTITAATFTTSLAGGSGPAVAIDKVTDRWATAADLTDQLGNVDVYDDGYRHWHIADRPTTVGTITATYKTGPGGTISRLDEVDNREEWYNYARLVYRWTDSGGTDHEVVGAKSITSGPFAAVAGVNRRMYQEVRELEATSTTAATAAASVLRRLMSRGRTLTFRARADLLLRPGHSIRVEHADQAWEHLVSRVTLDSSGWMEVTTRYPEAYTIT